MAEFDKQVNFNGFHILIPVFIISLLLSDNVPYMDIINAIPYRDIINLNNPGFWFIILHILITYIILTCIKFELGFRAAIKINI